MPNSATKQSPKGRPLHLHAPRLLPDALRRSFLERCAAVGAGAPLAPPEAGAAPEICKYQQDQELYRRRAKSFKNIFVIEAC